MTIEIPAGWKPDQSHGGGDRRDGVAWSWRRRTRRPNKCQFTSSFLSSSAIYPAEPAARTASSRQSQNENLSQNGVVHHETVRIYCRTSGTCCGGSVSGAWRVSGCGPPAASGDPSAPRESRLSAHSCPETLRCCRLQPTGESQDAATVGWQPGRCEGDVAGSHDLRMRRRRCSRP